MKLKATGLLALVLICVAISGCNVSFGADATGKKWIALMEKHKKALEEDKFDIAAFKAEAKPIADELAQKKDKTQNKVLLSDDVLADFKRVSNEFEELLKKKGTNEQVQAYLEILAIWTGDKDDDKAGNAEGNAAGND